MRKIKEKVLVICVIGTFLFSGCGTAPYELTEAEEDIIVNYSAHVVSKFNTYQGDGLTYVNQQIEEAEEEVPEKIETETETEESVEHTLEGGAIPEGDTDEPVGQSASLGDVFGTDGLAISYLGYELRPDYMENDVYSVNAGAGKQYLILNIEIANAGETEISLDNLDTEPSFDVNFVSDSGDNLTASAYTTLLLNDFSTYEKTIMPQETEQAVLLFEVPDTITSAEQIRLQVQINGTYYEINL